MIQFTAGLAWFAVIILTWLFGLGGIIKFLVSDKLPLIILGLFILILLSKKKKS